MDGPPANRTAGKGRETVKNSVIQPATLLLENSAAVRTGNYIYLRKILGCSRITKKLNGMKNASWLIGAVVVLAGIAWFNANRKSKAESDTTQVSNPALPFGTPPANSAAPAPANNAAGALAPAGRVNPPHGQPGHRCDLAVGAPLPDAGAVTSQPAPANTGISVAEAAQRLAATQPATPKGINPAHGQPGHRCDIPVGAPLNSKPATPNNAAAANLNNIVVSKGKNPPHGQPGHLCELPVGADLDSAKAAKAAKAKTDSTAQ
jgi:hypothetical protein